MIAKVDRTHASKPQRPFLSRNESQILGAEELRRSKEM
jgi:hypothetical protein